MLRSKVLTAFLTEVHSFNLMKHLYCKYFCYSWDWSNSSEAKFWCILIILIGLISMHFRNTSNNDVPMTQLYSMLQSSPAPLSCSCLLFGVGQSDFLHCIPVQGRHTPTLCHGPLCSWSRSSVNLLVSVAWHPFSVSGRHGDWRRWLNVADSLNLCESLPNAKGHHMHQEEIKRTVENCVYLRNWWCDQAGFASN